MKKILYMASSLDGYIAREDDSTDFVTDNEWKQYIAKAKEVWAIIIWKRTYEVMRDGKEFDNLKWVRVYVISNSVDNESKNITFLRWDLKDSLKNVVEDKILIAWWSKLIHSFFKENLVDEIIIDIEPIVLWNWIPLFSWESINEKNLELISVNRFWDNEVQLHYIVIK